jgi:hypothetical protein
MALQQTYIIGDGAKGHHRFVLYISEDTTSIATNQSHVSWEFVLQPLGNGWDWYYSSQIPVNYIVTINGVQHTGNIMSYDGKSTVSLAAGYTDITHNQDGYKDISFGFSVWSMDKSYLPGAASASGTMPLTYIPRQANILSAPNFTDLDNPTITYSNPAGTAVESLQACIVYFTDKQYAIAGYREIEKTSTSYTFELTEEEKSILYAATANSKTLDVTFYVTTIIGGVTYYSTLHRTATIVDADPVIDETIATPLGRPGVVISGCNYTEFSFTAHAVKGASVKERTVTCGGRTAVINSANYGALENVESPDFIFTVTDTRGNSTSKPVSLEFVPYVKPTCNLDVDMNVVEGTTAQAKLTISGTAYGGLLGTPSSEAAESNMSGVGYRWRTLDGEYDDWTVVDSNSIYDYSYEVVVPNLNDQTTYVFQAMIFDGIYDYDNPVLSIEYTARAIPVFDWNDEDFSFNVPVMTNYLKAAEADITNLKADGKPVRAIGDTRRIARAYTQAELAYEGNSYVNLLRDNSPTDLYNQELVTFESNGLITVNKNMLALVNIHISGANGNGRSWIKLMNYDSDWAHTHCIQYGAYTTSTISIVLSLSAGTKLGIITAEPITVNGAGLVGSYVEIIEL